MMKSRNMGCKPASFLSLAAIGFEMVLKASVPSLRTGIIIVVLLIVPSFIFIYSNSLYGLKI